jgi:hypothetical protein
MRTKHKKAKKKKKKKTTMGANSAQSAKNKNRHTQPSTVPLSTCLPSRLGPGAADAGRDPST